MPDTTDSVNISITATTAQMRAELALAQAQTKALNAEVKALADQMVTAGAVGDKALTSALAAASAEAAASAGRVKELESALKSAEATTTQMHGSISTATREFRALFDELSSGRTRQTPGTLAIIAQRFFGLGPAALAATGAVAGLVGAFAYLAIEMERAAAAAEAGQAAFAFKGIDVSSEEVQQLAQRLFNLQGSSEKATAEVLRDFSSIRDATPELRAELVALIPAFQKATGDDVQNAGKALSAIFVDLDKNGRKFLESLNQTPEVTKALNDFNDAIEHGNRADAERVILEQLSAATDRVGKSAEENKGFVDRFMESLIGGEPNVQAITEAFKKETEALKNLGAAAQQNPTTTPQTVIPRDQFLQNLETIRQDNSKTQAQITRDLIAEYQKRIDDLRQHGQQHQQEDREQARLQSELMRQTGQEAEQATREQNSAILADDRETHIQQLQESVASWNQLLNSGKLTGDQFVEVTRQRNQAQSELNRAMHQEEQGIARTDAEAEIEISRLRLQTQLQLLDIDFQAHRVNADQKYQTMIRLTQQLADLDIQQLENEQTTYQAGTVAFEEAANKIRIAKAKLNADLARLDHQHVVDAANENKQENQAWQGMVRGIESAEQGLITNLLSGRQTLAQSLLQATGRILENEIAADLKAMTTRLLLARTEQTQKQALEQGGLLYHLFASNAATAQEAQSQAAQTGAVVAGVEARTAAQTAGAAEGHAVSAALGASTVMSDAAKAYSGAYSATVGIPYVGPIIAPIAGATAFAAVAAYKALASSAGGDLDTGSTTRLNIIHPHETILPASVAGPMRDFFSGGGGGGGGDTYHVHVNAIDTQSGTEFLMNNMDRIAQGLAMQIRIRNNTLAGAKAGI